jgi:hypothetical protein
MSVSTEKFKILKSKIYNNDPSVIIGKGNYGTVYKPPLIPETNIILPNEIIPYICENYIFEQRSNHVGKVFKNEQYCKNENDEMLKMPDEYKELTVKKICNGYSTVIIPDTGALNYQIIYEDGGISLNDIIDNRKQCNNEFHRSKSTKEIKRDIHSKNPVINNTPFRSKKQEEFKDNLKNKNPVINNTPFRSKKQEEFKDNLKNKNQVINKPPLPSKKHEEFKDKNPVINKPPLPSEKHAEFKDNFKEMFYQFAVNILQIMNDKNKYVHFDIKADNILWNQEKNKLLLIDFGISFEYSDDMAANYNANSIIYQNYIAYPLELYLIGLIYKDYQFNKTNLGKLIDKCIKDRENILCNMYNYNDTTFSSQLNNTKQYLIDFLIKKDDDNSTKEAFINKSLQNIYKTIDIFSLGQVYFGMLKVLKLEWNEHDKLNVNRMITLDVNDRMKYFDEIIKPKSPIPGGDSKSLFKKDDFNKPIITNLNINKTQMSILHKNRMKHYTEYRK